MTGMPEPQRQPNEEALLQQCLDRPEEQQLDELERLCQLHPVCAAGLRRRYAMLAQHGLVSLPLAPGMRLGAYRLLEELGRGGMGVVYLAEHVELQRRVALKLLSPTLLGSEHAATRFRREIAALAKIDHPGVCPVYEAGSANGQPFLAMRHVPGRTLAAVIGDARAAAQQLPIGQVVDWLAQTAEAVDSAHAVGLVHRDLKPANVMLGDDGRPVVLDFGLARDLDSEEPTLTASHEPVGTPAYMAPEQIRGGAVGSWTDVHALGAMLFEALTLSPAFAGVQRDEIFHRVTEESPPRLRLLRREASRDLELVVGACLDKEPQRRYARAGALARDLRRVLQKQPIAARPLPHLLRTWRWSQRNRVAAVVVVFLTALAITSTMFLLRLATADRAARGRNLVLASIAAEADSDLAALFAEAAYRLQPGVESLDFLRSSLFGVHEQHIQRSRGDVWHELVRVDADHVLVFGVDPWCELWQRDGDVPVARLPVTGRPLAAAVSPDGRIAVASDAGALQLFSPDGRQVTTLRTELKEVLSVAWLDQQRVLVTQGKRLVTLDLEGGPDTTISLPSHVWRAVLAADRRTLLLGGDGHAYVCAVVDGLPGAAVDLGGIEDAGSLYAVDLSADGTKLLAATSSYRSASVFNGNVTRNVAFLWVRRGAGYELQRTIEDYDGMAMRVRISPDGRAFAIGTTTGRVAVYDGDDGHLLRTSSTSDGTVVTSVAWSPASDRFAVVDTNRTTRLFDARGHLRDVLRCFSVFAAQFADDGSELLTLGFSELQRHRLDFPERLVGNLPSLYFAGPVGDDLVITCGKSPQAWVWRQGKVVAELRDPDVPPGWILHAAATSRGEILTSSSDSRVRRYRRDGSLVARSDVAGTAGSWLSRVLPLPDDRLVVVSNGGAGAALLSSDLLKIQQLVDVPAGWGGDVTPDGRWFAAVGMDGHRAQVLDLSCEPPKLHWQAPVESTWLVRAIAISEDGRIVAVGGGDGWVTRFDLVSGAIHRWRTHEAIINDIDMAADGRLATASGDRTAAVWSPDGQPLAHLRGHAVGLWSARFTADGRHVITASEDGTARIWPLDADLVDEVARRDLHPEHREDELADRADLLGDLLQRGR